MGLIKSFFKIVFWPFSWIIRGTKKESFQENQNKYDGESGFEDKTDNSNDTKKSAWIKRKRRKSAKPINFKFKKLFALPPVTETKVLDIRLHKIQRAVLMRVLDMLGEFYIPRRLDATLKKYDVFKSFQLFMNEINIDYNLLFKLAEDIEDKQELRECNKERELLSESLDLLMQADPICKVIDLDDKLIYEELAKRSIQRSKRLLDRLVIMGELYDAINKANIVFDGFKEFLAPLNKRISQGQIIERRTLDKLRIKLEEWHKVQLGFNFQKEKLLQSIDLLESGEYELNKEDSKYLAAVKIQTEEALNNAAKPGIDPVACVLQLIKLRAHLRDLEAKIQSEQDTEDYVVEEGLKSTLELALEVLNFTVSGVLDEVLLKGRLLTNIILKAQYKRMMKIWHPDRNKKPEALEVTKRINKAYSYLGNLVDVGGGKCLI